MPEPKPEPLAVHPYDILERAAQKQRETEETRLRYRGVKHEPELDWSEQQLRDAQGSMWRQLEIWADNLGNEELSAMNHQAAATTGRELRREPNDAGERPASPRPLDRCA